MNNVYVAASRAYQVWPLPARQKNGTSSTLQFKVGQFFSPEHFLLLFKHHLCLIFVHLLCQLSVHFLR